MKDEALLNFLRRAIQPLRDRIFMLTSRGLIKGVDDAAGLQECQLRVLSNEDLTRIQRLQEFGFTSHPPLESEAVVLALNGSRANSVIIATDNRAVRLKNLASGETAIYTDDGSYIHLKKAGEVEVKAATLLTVDVPDTVFKGNVAVEGTLDVDGATTLKATLEVQDIATFKADVLMEMNLAVLMNINCTGVIAAGGFTGPSGGPLAATVDITTTGTITGSNVFGGGTDLESIHDTYNTHTHPENGTGGGTTSAPNETL